MKLDEQKFIVLYLLKQLAKSFILDVDPVLLIRKRCLIQKRRWFHDMSTFIIRLSKITTHLLLPFRFLGIELLKGYYNFYVCERMKR